MGIYSNDELIRLTKNATEQPFLEQRIESEWEFVTSEGASASILFVSRSRGDFYIRKKGAPNQESIISLSYAAFGVGLGADLGISGSTIDTASAGKIYLGPGKRSLSINDFAGAAVIITADSAFIAGSGSALIYFGMSHYHRFNALLWTAYRNWGVTMGASAFFVDVSVDAFMNMASAQATLHPDIKRGENSGEIIGHNF